MATSRLSGTRKILAVLLDVTGVLYESGEGDGKAIKGSMEAVSRLRAAGFPLLFCTNETQITRGALVQRLQRLGLELREEEVHSPVLACRQFLQENGLRPYLIVHPSALSDYDGIATSDPNAVVLGDAASAFTYDTLNRAFRILIEQPGSTLISLGQGRYYREGDALAMDVGPFMKALEYATNMEAKVIGKPSQEFFLSAVKQLGVPPENAMMVGDDVVNDVGGAQSCGLFGVLVKTGKYRLGDENHPTVKPNRIVANLSEAVELLLQQR